MPPRPSQAQKNVARLAETMSLSSDSSDFHSPPGYTAHALGDLNEPKNMDFATAPVNTMLPGGDNSALQPFNLDSTADPSVGPTLAPSEPHARRLSMPTSTRPSLTGFQPHRPMHVKQHSMSGVPLHSGLSSFSQAYPLSMTHNTLQIVDGSGRPIANPQPPAAFSPSTGVGTLWITDVGKNDPLHRGSNDAPSFEVEDAATWARRGLGTLGDGLRPTEPVPINSAFDNAMQFGFPHIESTHVFQPGLPGSGMSNQPLIGAPTKTVPPALPAAASPNPSPQAPATDASAPARAPPATPAAQGSLPAVAQTVSPGVYQAGFSLQTASWMSPRATPTPSPPTAPLSRPFPAPTATATRSERRQSQAHPYSPPGGHRPVPAGALRQVGMGRNRDSLTMSINTAAAGAADDDGALPSASLTQPELFAGEIETKPDLE